MQAEHDCWYKQSALLPPELQRWTYQQPGQSGSLFVCLFVFVIKLNIICLQTHRCWHYGGLLTEETDRICIEKKVWTVFLWTIWSACRTSPALPLISLLGCSCSLCFTQTINSQSRVQRSGESPNEPRDTDSGGWMTPARAPGHRERPKRSTVCLHNYSL